MTNQEKLQLAADRIVEFGLDGTRITAEQVRLDARIGAITITWEPTGLGSEVTLRVIHEAAGEIRISVESRMVRSSPDNALVMADMLDRVAVLACKIEVAIANAEWCAANPAAGVEETWP